MHGRGGELGAEQKWVPYLLWWREDPYQLNLVVDSSTAARCSALDTALDFNLGTMAPVCTAGAALWRPAAATRP